jgi:hypothetical protein
MASQARGTYRCHMGRRRSRGRRNVLSLMQTMDFLASPGGGILILLLWWADVPARTIAIAAGIVVIYYLGYGRRICYAVNTDDRTHCGENARGILGACHRRRHQLQNRWRFVPTAWRPAYVRQAFPRPSTRPRTAQGAAVHAAEAVHRDQESWGSMAGLQVVFSMLSFVVGVLSLVVVLAQWTLAGG